MVDTHYWVSVEAEGKRQLAVGCIGHNKDHSGTDSGNQLILEDTQLVDRALDYAKELP